MAEHQARPSVSDLLPSPKTAKEHKVSFLELPAHAPRDSLLHHASGFDNYRGLYNLALIALVVSSIRVAMENLFKYGILVNPMEWIDFLVSQPQQWVCFRLAVLLPLFGWTTVLIEQGAATGFISTAFAKILHWSNILFLISLPIYVIMTVEPHPLFSSMVLFHYCIFFLKIISYVQVNEHYRLNRSESPPAPPTTTAVPTSPPFPTTTTTTATHSLKEKKEPAAAAEQEEHEFYTDGPKVSYPNNLTIRDFAYFIMVPTLCYELNFPRNRIIRKRFLLRRIFEFFFFSFVALSLAQQWIVPTVSNTMAKKEPSLFWLIERTLKLSLPNNVLWLAFFYCYFHSYLNIMGEIFRFADRQFYRDWWNATTIDYFWRNWNIPVHKWAFRHVYQPLLNAGYTKTQAQLAVFLLSAFFHELLVSVPLHMFKLWFFMGMIFQMPLALLTSKVLKNTQYGNIVVWFSLVIGQPSLIMMYVQAFINKPHHH